MPDETINITTLTKSALRIPSDVTAFDQEINDLIAAAKVDLNIAGVEVPTELDSIVRTAIVTYVKVHFGQPDEYDRLKASYDEQKAQLATATGYTDWGVI